jgi:hypothetical protein
MVVEISFGCNSFNNFLFCIFLRKKKRHEVIKAFFICKVKKLIFLRYLKVQCLV